MTFVYTANPPASDGEPEVANDPWFPAITPAEVREACMLDGTVTPARLRQALLSALDSVNEELHAYREAREAEGHARLADVPARLLGGESVQLTRYRRAVLACIQALVAEAHREIDTVPHSDGKEGRIRERIETKLQEHRRAMRWAISDLLGLPRHTVELI